MKLSMRVHLHLLLLVRVLLRPRTTVRMQLLRAQHSSHCSKARIVPLANRGSQQPLSNTQQLLHTAAGPDGS